MRLRSLLVLATLALVPSVSFAAPVTLPHTFSNGATATRRR